MFDFISQWTNVVANYFSQYLFYACKNNQLLQVNLLLMFNIVNINTQDKWGNTPLHIATEYGHYKLVEMLLKHPEIMPNIKNVDEKTPLHLSCQKKPYEASYIASKENNIKILYALINHPGILVNATGVRGWSPLGVACFWRNQESVFALLSKEKIDVNIQNEEGNTPLHIAHINTDYDQGAPLVELESKMSLPIVNALLAREDINVNIKNKKGETPLHVDVRLGEYYLAKKIMKYPYTKINEQNNKGETPLHLACKEGFEKTVLALLNSPDIDVELIDHSGKTASYYASKNNNHVIQGFFKKASININESNRGIKSFDKGIFS
ncbi:MAG: ankyrin repeat domain-containing protein [Tatlockia sp.]|jgi:ankyrin repeat protein